MRIAIPYWMICGLMCWQLASAQATGRIKRVLFIGNSYTAVNNLPEMVSKMAASAGDSVFTAMSTPGGFTFQGHTTHQPTLSLIQQPGWDYVVLQEQSQRPAFPQSQVELEVFPYAKALDSLIHLANPCAKVVFYRTWGRQNGDQANCAQWPPVCTYAGMDSLLALRYRQMADSNKALLCPVGDVWKKVRSLLPQVSLYQSDGSHPEIAGSYLAASAFYSIFFQNNPEVCNYKASLDSVTARQLRTVVREVVFDSLPLWNLGLWHPVSMFSWNTQGLQVQFQNNSFFASKARWTFGDGQSDTTWSPSHLYANPGNYTVLLISEHCNTKDSVTNTVFLNSTDLQYSDKEEDRFLYQDGHYKWIWETQPTQVMISDLAGRRTNMKDCRFIYGKRGDILLLTWFRNGRENVKKLIF